MLSSSVLKPGDKGSLKAAVNTAGTAGPISKSVEVYTNDPVRPMVRLLLKAQVNAELKAP